MKRKLFNLTFHLSLCHHVEVKLSNRKSHKIKHQNQRDIAISSKHVISTVVKLSYLYTTIINLHCSPYSITAVVSLIWLVFSILYTRMAVYYPFTGGINKLRVTPFTHKHSYLPEIIHRAACLGTEMCAREHSQLIYPSNSL